MTDVRLRTAVLPILVASILAIGCSGGDATSDPDPVATVFIIEDAGTEGMVAEVLSNAGHTATMGGIYHEFSTQDISSYDLVVLLNGVHWTMQIPQAGQTNLRDYVASGGTLLVTEWVSWSGSTNQTINEILPTTYGGTWENGGETYTRTANHPIAEGLPATFDVPDDWSYSVTVRDPNPAKHAVTVFSGSESNSAVTVGRHGDGAIVQWNMGGHYNGDDIWTQEVRRLLANVATYARTRRDAR